MKRYAQKFMKSIKKDGIFKTIKKCFRAVKYRLLFKNNRKYTKVLNSTVDFNKYKRVIVFENNFGWTKIMKQRPQQIAENFNDETLFIYHSSEDNDYKKHKNRINKIKDNLFLIDLGYYRDALIDCVNKYEVNKYLMVYSTDYIPFETIKKYLDNKFELIYEYVDDFNVDLNGKDLYELLIDRHKKILKENPYVICTANELYNKSKKDKCKNLTMICNGVDYNHFKTNNNDIPEDLKDIRKKYKTIICYYGALASWFDYELINEIAKNKDYGIILMGIDYDNTLNKSDILKNDNVYYLGKKDYNELPIYGHNSDLFIIPFVINSITKATSPVKIFEYMAMGKPIITTALPECKKYKSVLYSNNHKEFISNLEKGIKLINDKKYLNVLDKEAKENTWSSKASQILDFVDKKKKKGKAVK